MSLQIDLDFEGGLTQRFRSLTEVCAAAVYSSRGGLGGVASELDTRSSLSKLLPEIHWLVKTLKE